MNTAVKAKGINTFHLKLIAYISMFIDHVGACILKPYTDAHLETMGYKLMRQLDVAYDICRTIGRLAFPIFVFLLVQGFFLTRSRLRYLIRLLIFVLVSEIPFDLAISGRVWAWNSQSVMITLSIGFLVLTAFDFIRKFQISPTLQCILMLVPAVLGCLAAHFSKCDYSFKGVLMIVGIYLIYPMFTLDRKSFVLCGGTLFFWEWINNWHRITGSLAFIPLLFYNGEKGRDTKWFLYLFYPLHLLLIYFIFTRVNGL